MANKKKQNGEHPKRGLNWVKNRKKKLRRKKRPESPNWINYTNADGIGRTRIYLFFPYT